MRPFDKDAVEIERVCVAAAMVKLYDWLAFFTGELESATCAVIVKLPDFVGDPEICPVAATSVKPAGNDPEVKDHRYGMVPPVAASEPV